MAFSCSDDSSEIKIPITTNLSIEGLWESECYSTNSEIFKTQFRFYSGEYALTKISYEDAGCAGELFEESYEGLYIIGNLIETESGMEAYELNLLENDEVDDYYTIYKVNLNELFFGDETKNNDCSIPETRATELDWAHPFNRLEY